ncbi:DinB family protein [Halobacillus litoralis]|uniref:DinB family protein n=1 Tax=Halobacillus litoralis TaxID=45668 RepID=UPI001CD6DF53|nr:DinB family protein [Halobacillus litoralis]MCA0970854.1 DinB family protein [Halobacillus litoralis]
MADIKTLISDQFLANANDRSWYISFSESVEGLSENEAFWKPDNSSHSVAEIVQHLIYWNEAWQVRYRKQQVSAVDSIPNDETFHTGSEKSFSELKDTLLRVLLEWQDLLTPEQLELKVQGFPVDAEWWAILSNATTHNAYHIGQIMYIRKMQKARNV